MATPDEVAAVVGQLGVIYSRDLDPATPGAWASLFTDVPASALFEAAAEHARESRFFPTPADLRARAVRSQNMPTSEEAWLEVKRAISKWGYYGEPRFTHKAISDAVEAIGWDDLCSMQIGDQSAERAHFLRCYGAYRERRVKATQIGEMNPGVAKLIKGVGEVEE